MVEIKNFNAKGDGITNDTAAVQAALDSGEVVHFTPGTYMCGTLFMRSNGGIDLDEGATLMAISGKEHYNADDFSPRNLVFTKEHTTGAHFIIAEDCENISFSGKGKISGNYRSVFDITQTDSQSRPHYVYPEWRMSQMIFLVGCRNVKISDVTICDVQYWSCFLLDCEKVHISGVTIKADRLVMNADGLDIDCCRDVLIENCDIDCGDDCIAIRANESHAKRQAPCDGVEVRNCQLRSPACAVRIGVGNGTLRNCTLKELQIRDSSIGVGLCPSYSRGKCVEIDNILFENVYFEGKSPFVMLPFWGSVSFEDDPAVKRVQNITLRNFHAQCTKASLVAAPAQKQLWRNFCFDNVTIKVSSPLEHLGVDRWPFEELGILNVYRFPEIDLSGFKCESTENMQEVVFKE